MSSTEISLETIIVDEDEDEDDDENSFVSNTDAIIYAASDISGWTQSLISDNNIPNSSSSTSVDEHDQQISNADDSDDDSMIVSSSASSSWFMNNQQIDDQQALMIFNVDFRELCNNTRDGFEFHGGLLADTDLSVNEETSVRLVNTLMACAEAIQENNLSLADVLITDIRRLTVSQNGEAMKKVASYFAEAFYHKIHRTNPQDFIELSYFTDKFLLMSFYESCPLLKFAYFTANQSILEAFANSKRVHIIDFSFNQGLQWPPLLQALTLRPGGPPAFRLSGIGGYPLPDDSTDSLQKAGWKLSQFAQSIGVEFEFRGYMVHTLADLQASMLNIRPCGVEAVAVNSIFELHRLFSIPGAIEKVLDLIRKIQPKIVTMVEQEANHNGSVFMNRTNEAWHYYSTMFGVLEDSATDFNISDVLMTEQYLGKEINNLVACEGTKRVVRHETLGQWRVRFDSAGFNLVPLTSSMYIQANMLLDLYIDGEGYQMEEKDGYLMFSRHSQPLFTTSSWQLRLQV